MRFACCFLLICVGCTAQPAPQAPTPVAATPCPACPDATCPETVCPEKTCPECPKAPSPPVAGDWYCMDLHRTTGELSGYCWTGAKVCEQKRKDAERQRLGKTTPCITQRIAFCLQITDNVTMSRQTMCARTAENCEIRQKQVSADPSRQSRDVGECQPTLNHDIFKDPQGIEPATGP